MLQDSVPDGSLQRSNLSSVCDSVVCERVAYERVLFENVVCVCEKDTKAMWMSPSATHAIQSQS